MKDLQGETSSSATNEKELQIQRYESQELRIQRHCKKTMQPKATMLERCLKG